MLLGGTEDRLGLTWLRKEPQERSQSPLAAPHLGMPPRRGWMCREAVGQRRCHPWRWSSRYSCWLSRYWWCLSRCWCWLSRHGAGTWCLTWAGWREPGLVPALRAGLSIGGRGGDDGDGGPGSSSAAFQALRVSWCCLVAATAFLEFAGLWDSSGLFSSCSSQHLHLLGSCPAPPHQHQPVQRVRARPLG